MLTIEFLFKDGGVTFSEADNLYGVHRYRLVVLQGRHQDLTQGRQKVESPTLNFFAQPKTLFLYNSRVGTSTSSPTAGDAPAVLTYFGLTGYSVFRYLVQKIYKVFHNIQ